MLNSHLTRLTLNKPRLTVFPIFPKKWKRRPLHSSSAALLLLVGSVCSPLIGRFQEYTNQENNK